MGVKEEGKWAHYENAICRQQLCWWGFILSSGGLSLSGLWCACPRALAWERGYLLGPRSIARRALHLFPPDGGDNTLTRGPRRRACHDARPATPSSGRRLMAPLGAARGWRFTSGVLPLFSPPVKMLVYPCSWQPQAHVSSLKISQNSLAPSQLLRVPVGLLTVVRRRRPPAGEEESKGALSFAASKTAGGGVSLAHVASFLGGRARPRAGRLSESGRLGVTTTHPSGRRE